MSRRKAISHSVTGITPLRSADPSASRATSTGRENYGDCQSRGDEELNLARPSPKALTLRIRPTSDRPPRDGEVSCAWGIRIVFSSSKGSGTVGSRSPDGADGSHRGIGPDAVAGDGRRPAYDARVDVGQVAMVGLAGTLLGASIAGFVALAVTALTNSHAVNMAGDERRHQEKVRKHIAGVQSAKEALGHINRIRGVFDSFEYPGDPEQSWYESAYRDAVLAAVDIDDDAAAKTLTDVAEAYWLSWLATDLDEYTSHGLSHTLYKLAHATVRAYTQDKKPPDRRELDDILGEIASNGERRADEHERSRLEWIKDREEKRAAEAAAEPA